VDKKKRLKYILATVLCICVFVAFLLSPLFNLKTINVEGCEYYQSEEIHSTLSHLKNKNYFIMLFENTPFSHLDYLFKGRLYNSEQQLIIDKPYLKSAEISFSFPGKGLVKVSERVPSFCTRNGDAFLLVDSEGVVLEAFFEDAKFDYPVIEGIETSDYRVGNTLVGKGTDTQLELAIKICRDMSQIEFLEGFIDIIDVSDTNRIWMFVKPSLSICFGDESNLSIKMSLLKEILTTKYDGDSNGVIDFTNGENPIFKKNQSSLLPGTDTGGNDNGESEIVPEVLTGENNFLDLNLLG